MQNDAYQTEHDIAAESAMLTGEHQDHLYVVGSCNGERFEAMFVKNAAGDFDTSWTPFRQCWLAGDEWTDSEIEAIARTAPAMGATFVVESEPPSAS